MCEKDSDIDILFKPVVVKEETKPLSCLACGQLFDQEPLFNEHLKIHIKTEDQMVAPNNDFHSQTPPEARVDIKPMKDLFKTEVKSEDQMTESNNVVKSVKICEIKPVVVKEETKPLSCLACGQLFDQEPLFNEHLKIHIKTEDQMVAPNNDFHSQTPPEARVDIKPMKDLFKTEVKSEDQMTASNNVVKSGATSEEFVYGSVDYGFTNSPECDSTKSKSHKCDICDTRHCEESPCKPRILKDSILNNDKSEVPHIITVHIGESLHKCELCDKTFPFEYRLKRHMAVHTTKIRENKRENKREICDKAFRLNPNLKQHVSIHTDEGPHKCKVCDKKFSRKGDLERHMHYICQFCNKMFSYKSRYKNHMLVHTGEKPHKCEFCGTAFSRKFYLEQHRTVHTGERPKKCEICDKTFVHQSEERRHMLRHSQTKLTKPHKCELCDWTFTLKTDLKRHMTVHTGEKPHKCQFCGKTFGYKSSFNKHMLVHTGKM